MGDEPRVDALHVEAMVARGQHSELFPFGELGEADGAVDEGRRRSGGGGCAVDNSRQSFHRLLLEPRVGQPNRGLVRRLEQGHSPAAAQCAPEHGIQTHGAHESAQQSRQDDHQIGVEIVVHVQVRVPWLVVLRGQERLLKLPVTVHLRGFDLETSDAPPNQSINEETSENPDCQRRP